VKNITVSVPDDLYRAARIAAAERGTSVSALVSEQLVEITGAGDKAREYGRRDLLEMLEEVRRNNPGFSASKRLPREQLYTRGTR
jgi:hypothetical protein